LELHPRTAPDSVASRIAASVVNMLFVNIII
jgi:hypothetical protein